MKIIIIQLTKKKDRRTEALIYELLALGALNESIGGVKFI